MRLILAFLSGLACAVLLGAAAPRGAPIKWQYRLLDLDAEAGKLQSAIRERAAATRSSFPDDRAAAAAAEREVYAAWARETFGDGWMPMIHLEVDDGGKLHAAYTRNQLVIGKPTALRAAPARRQFDHSAFAASIATRDAKELLKAERSGGMTIRRDGALWSEAWHGSTERRAFVLEKLTEELNRCGEAGAAITTAASFGFSGEVMLHATTLSD